MSIARNQARRPASRALIGAIGMIGACLFIGGAVITPAISVLTAVEGLHVAAPAIGQHVLAITGMPHLLKHPEVLLAFDPLQAGSFLVAHAGLASQAVISGTFSLIAQAIQLQFPSRQRVIHTSTHHAGQIYLPLANVALMCAVIGLVLFFGSSERLAAA